REPFLYRLVPVLVNQMGGVFPELKFRAGQAQDVIRGEEVDFLKTIERGLKLFQEAAERARPNRNVISGKDVFDLHTTYRLYIAITEQMAAEGGLSVDLADFEERMRKHRETGGQGQKKMVISAVSGELPRTDDSLKYQVLSMHGHVIGWVRDNTVIRTGRLEEEEAALLLDRTNFYAEQGGQVGDSGSIRTATGIFQVD